VDRVGRAALGTAESADVLPGAGVFAPDANGDLVLVGRPRGGPAQRRAG
jgi:hypothetical protein